MKSSGTRGMKFPGRRTTNASRGPLVEARNLVEKFFPVMDEEMKKELIVAIADLVRAELNWSRRR